MRFSVGIILIALIFATAVSAYPMQYRLRDGQKNSAVGRTGAQDQTKRPRLLRNCYLSPVQCLLPLESHRFRQFHPTYTRSN